MFKYVKSLNFSSASLSLVQLSILEMLWVSDFLFGGSNDAGSVTDQRVWDQAATAGLLSQAINPLL